MPAADPPAPANAATTTPAASTVVADKPTEDSANFIDLVTFDQICEMDDDGNDEFSRTIVFGFLDQAKDTFERMDKSLRKRDLIELARLGHFLKGSSATLGLINVKDCCEKIQNFGGNKDATGVRDMPDDDKCLAAIDEALKNMREEYVKAEGYFKKRYPPLRE